MLMVHTCSVRRPPPKILCAATTPASATPVQRVAAPLIPKESRPKSTSKAPFINVIESTQWSNGVPAVQGAHLMASGTVAPISTSKSVLSVTKHIFDYPDGATTCAVFQYPGEAIVAEGLAEIITNAAKTAIEAKGSFTLVLSGGSLVKLLGTLEGKEAQWDKWHVFWVDERVVSHDSPDSNYKGASEAFLTKVAIPSSNIYPIAENVTAEQAAVHYEGILIQKAGQNILPKTEDNFPIFDLVLLGVGPDGHVASLFPNRSETAAKKGWVLPITNSPKPPSDRITLTMPVINAATQVAIVALGDGKAEIVQRILEVQSLPGAIPAQLVRPRSTDLTWILDGASARLLKIHDWDNSKAFPRSTS